MKLAAVVALAALVACASAPHPAPTSDATAELTARSAAWDSAIVRKDRAAIEANMADDFRQIDGSGKLETKKSFVEGVVDPELTIQPYTVEDFEIRRYGNVALLSGRTEMHGTYGKDSFTSHYRYIDIYVLGDAGWRIVSVQISKIPR